MALHAEIDGLLDRLEARLAEAGQDGLDGADLSARLRAIVGQIGDTVLPRSIVYETQGGLACTLTVASRRLIRLSVSTPEGNQVIAASAGADRGEQLLTMAEALAGLAAIEEPMSLRRFALADGVAADEVGHAAADIAAFCAQHDWFAGTEVADSADIGTMQPVEAGWSVFGTDGGDLQSGGDPAFALDPVEAAQVAAERAGWPKEVAALAGTGFVVLARTAAGAVAIGPDAGGTRVTFLGPAPLEAQVAAVLRKDGGEG